jgi:hypothetical protein
VKSFKEAHPDLGCASAPVDVQRYDEGRSHVCAVAIDEDASKTMQALIGLRKGIVVLFIQLFWVKEL